MSEPFLSEIRMVSFNFAPKGWALCNGQLMPINQNQALFSLLGTTYGGDGRSTFGLPNLQGMTPMFYGQGPGLSLHDIGETGGVETVTLLSTEIPGHGHTVNATTSKGNTDQPNGSLLGEGQWSVQGSTGAVSYYTAQTSPLVQMNPSVTGVAGGGFPHNNMMPYVTLNF